MRCIACGCLSLVLACSFDPTGLGETPGAAVTVPDVVTTETGDPPGPTSTGGPITGDETGTVVTEGGSSTTGALEPSTGAPDPTTGDDTTTTGEPDQTTGPDPCEMPTKVLVLAVDASVADPMAKYLSNQGEGTVVYSKVADQGTADFAVSLACGGEVAVWARVLDLNPGANEKDPDSLHIRVDGGEEKTWFYGCQTYNTQAGYRWLRVHTRPPNKPCEESMVLTPNLPAGTHNFMFRNREAMNEYNDVAALARVLVTTDLNYVPGDDE